MRKLIETGAVWEVTDLIPDSPECWYITHHLVSHNGKFCLVFNCSYQYQGQSLNQYLLPGPTIGASLLGVLVRFREHPVAVSGDIKAMFHQVRLIPEDCPLLRFLCRNLKMDEAPKFLEWQVLPIGTTSSPCCATYALQRHVRQHHLTDEAIRFSVERCLLQTIMQNYYIRIEDMPSLVSHQLSIIKYVVLKKIFFFLCFDRLIWTWTWTWTWTRTSLDSDLTRTRTSLDLDLTWTRTSLDLDLSWTRQRWTWLQPYVILLQFHNKSPSCRSLSYSRPLHYFCIIALLFLCRYLPAESAYCRWGSEIDWSTKEYSFRSWIRNSPVGLQWFYCAKSSTIRCQSCKCGAVVDTGEIRRPWIYTRSELELADRFFVLQIPTCDVQDSNFEEHL